jgi:hypothetical protein
VDTFVAPSKTCIDLRRSASWWLPAVLIIFFTVIAVYVPLKKVGVEEMRDAMLKSMPKVQDMVDNSPPEQAAKIRKSFEDRFRSNLYTVPITLLVAGFLVGILFMATANFAFGGKSTYWQMVAVFWYSQLPLIISAIIVIILLMAGVGTETFNAMNPIGTNPGFYMTDSSPVLVAILTAIDAFSIWVFALQVIGISKVAKISTGAAFGTGAIWWVIYVGLFKVGIAALFS